MSSDPGGFWAIAKSPDPGNVLNFVRNDGTADTVPYTLNPTGTPANATDLVTKDYFDNNPPSVSGTPDTLPLFDASGDLISRPGSYLYHRGFIFNR